MQRRDNDVMVIVLQGSQPIGQEASVVVIDERNRAYDKRIGSDDGGPHQSVTDQVAEGFRTILIALVLRELVEAGKKFRINRYTDPAKITHFLMITSEFEDRPYSLFSGKLIAC